MTSVDRLALYDLYSAYGGLIDAAEWDTWLGLFAAVCRYQIIPRENAELGLPAGLIFCDSRAVSKTASWRCARPTNTTSIGIAT